MIQLYSSFETNRKQEIDGQFANKVYGIVTNGEAWYFIKFLMDGDKPKISIHSEMPIILDWTKESEPLEKDVERILGWIIWLLKRLQDHAIRIQKKKKINMQSIHLYILKLILTVLLLYL